MYSRSLDIWVEGRTRSACAFTQRGKRLSRSRTRRHHAQGGKRARGPGEDERSFSSPEAAILHSRPQRPVSTGAYQKDRGHENGRKMNCHAHAHVRAVYLTSVTQHIASIWIHSATQVAMARSLAFAFLLYLFVSYTAEAGKGTSTYCTRDVSHSLYNFTTKYLNGTAVSLSNYRGQVSLVLNVATYWGYAEQYPHLNALMREFSTGKYKCGFSVLAFPCNQFMYQEPGANAKEILNGLKCVRPGNGFEPNFPLFQKTQVNGKNEDPIYTFLKVIWVIFWRHLMVVYVEFLTYYSSSLMAEIYPLARD